MAADPQAPVAGVIAAIGMLDLDDIGPEIGERHGAQGARHHSGQVENAEPGKRLHGGHGLFPGFSWRHTRRPPAGWCPSHSGPVRRRGTRPAPRCRRARVGRSQHRALDHPAVARGVLRDVTGHRSHDKARCHGVDANAVRTEVACKELPCLPVLRLGSRRRARCALVATSALRDRCYSSQPRPGCAAAPPRRPWSGSARP